MIANSSTLAMPAPSGVIVAGRPRILLVDDNPDIHSDFHRVFNLYHKRDEDCDQIEIDLFGELARGGAGADGMDALARLDIDSAHHGGAAVDMVRQARTAGRPYAIVFMDVRMPPGIDGVEAAARIWDLDRDVQIVLCSAHSDYSWPDLVSRLGMRDNLLVLGKPFDQTEVLQITQALIRKWALAQQLHQRVLDLEADIRERTQDLEKANATLQELVDRDPLTGVLNRRGLERVLASELARQRRAGEPLMAMIIDCDHFKTINDRGGYAVGDEVLIEIARRLRSALRSSDHLGRLGGDEFLALVPQTGRWDAARMAERLRLAVGAWSVAAVSDELNVTVSVGVTEVPQGAALEEVSARVCPALQQAKRDGRNRVSHLPGDRALPVDADLARRLADAGLFRAAWQPIVRLSDARPLGVELLSRSDIDGFGGPDHFFRLALDHQILTLVDLQCLEICAHRAAEMPVGLDVHLNVFGSTLINVPVERILAATGALPDPRRLCLEVSEQQFFVDSTRLRTRLAELREAGMRIALDDVGFGRTSLELLLLLAPDVVKIDRQFVTGCGADEGRLLALKRLVDVISAIGAVIIAEGVETRADRDAVASLGISYAQGYFWGRPEEGDPSGLAASGWPRVGEGQ